MAIKPVVQTNPNGVGRTGPGYGAEGPGVMGGETWYGESDWGAGSGGAPPRPSPQPPTPPPTPETDIDRLRAIAEGRKSYADPAYRKRVEEQKTRIAALSRSNLGMGVGSRQQMASNAQSIMTQGTNFNAKQLQLREQDDARAALAAAISAQQAGDLEASSMLLESLKQKYENRDAPGTPWWLTSAGAVAGPAAGWYINQNQQQSQAQTVDALNRANRGY